jgi:muramoyltetrapeptide carboxypeptidase
VGRHQALKLPPALAPGDLIAVAAPASAFDRAAFRRGAELIAARGYRVTYRDDIFARAGYFAGDDARRAAELNAWIRDPDVKAILCARGGWGTARIVEQLDLRAIARRPKLVAGFSDLTTLLLALTQRAGVAAIHGPMVVNAGKGPDGARDLTRLLSLLSGATAPLVHRGLRALRPGRARAPLTGGNLTLLAHSVGTPCAIEARGRILFFEDVDEPLYRIDRSVRQLLLAGVFRGVAGIALGSFSGLKPAEVRAAHALFLEALGNRAVPVVSGVAAGHQSPNRALPFGVPATLDADKGTLIFDPCVTTIAHGNATSLSSSRRGQHGK